MTFWEKVKEFSESVGKLTLAGAGMAIAATVGAIGIGLGYMHDLGIDKILLLGAAGVILGPGAIPVAMEVSGIVDGALDIGSRIFKTIAENSEWGAAWQKENPHAGYGGVALDLTTHAVEKLHDIAKKEEQTILCDIRGFCESSDDFIARNSAPDSPKPKVDVN